MSIPTAGDDNYSIDLEGRSGVPKTSIGDYDLNIDANDASFFNDSLTYSIVSFPSLGRLAFVTPNPSPDQPTVVGVPLKYNPDWALLGTEVSAIDSFVYRVTDTDGNTNTATVTINLTQSSKPTAADDYLIATPGVPVTVDVKENDTEATGQPFTIVPDSFSSIASGSAGFSITADDKITYTPDTDTIGEASFTYQITNGTNTSSATVFVTLAPDIPSNFTTTHRIEVGASVVSELNGAVPPAITTPFQTSGTSYNSSTDPKDIFLADLIEGKTYRVDLEGADTSAGSLLDPLLTIFTEPPGGFSGDSFTFTTRMSFDSPESHTPNAASVTDDDSGIGANASITHIAAFTGTHYIAADSGNQTANGTYKLTLTLLDDNNVPVANDDTATVRVGGSVQINVGLNDSDPDEDTLVTTLVTTPSQGNAVVGDNSNFYDFITYTPNSEASGSDSFTYQVSDGKGGTNTATVTITINDADSSVTVTGSEVYRFFNTQSGTHFYSRDEFEANSILANLPHYRLDGPAFKAADPINGPTEDVFRFFNTQSGTHLFTQDTNERDVIIATMDHFNFEGIAYQGHPDAVDGSVPLYRFFNTQTGGHFYTVNEAEKDNLIATASDVYNFENVAYNVYRPTDVEIAPVQSDPIPIVGTISTIETELGAL